MKSKLFVPGSRPDLFEKAFRSGADAVSFDLEDAVADERKPAARQALHALLSARAALPSTARGRQIVIVRVNACDTRWFDDDIAAVVQPGVDIVNLPKPRDADDIRAAAAALERAERTNGVTMPVRLLVNIESPVALRIAPALASAHARVMGLQLGLGDLFEPLGIARREVAAVRHVMLVLRMAAGEAGVLAYDAAFADIGDAAGFRAEAELARRLGFAGKSCIHPSQIAIANEVFRPTDLEIAHALKVIEAAHEAQASGTGAYVIDGRMVDRPFVERARAIVASAVRLGLVPEPFPVRSTPDHEVPAP